MRNYLVAAGLCLLTAAPAYVTAPGEDSQLVTRSAEVGIGFTAGFLHPGAVAALDTKRGMRLGPIYWTSETTGQSPAQMWDVNSTVEFVTTGRRDEITELHINPLDRGGAPLLWEVWRHRHAYVHLPGGYVWNSLQDVRDPMSEEDGRFYDKFLKGVWTYWAMKKMPDHLTKPFIPADPLPVDERFETTVPITFDGYGLKEPLTFPLRINLWEIPVLMTFEVNPSSASSAANQLAYKARWTYDLADWRQRHGYKKDFWGYSWESGYPAESALTTEQGKKLDRLLDHCVSYWVDVAAQQLLADFEYKLALQMEQP